MSVIDHGNARTTFAGGASRENPTGKGRYDLLPPEGVFRLARHYENGAVKYGDNNWTTGMPITRVLDSLIRHAFQYMEGDRSEDHMAAVCWNSMAIMAYETKIKLGKMSKEFLHHNDPQLNNEKERGDFHHRTKRIFHVAYLDGLLRKVFQPRKHVHPG